MRTIPYLAVLLFLAIGGAVRADAEWDYFAEPESQDGLAPSRLDKLFDVSAEDVSKLANRGDSQGQSSNAPPQHNATTSNSSNSSCDCCDCCRPRNWWVRVEY